MMRTSILLVLFCLVLPLAANAKENLGSFDKPMKFELAGNGGNCSGCEWISAIGVINENTPKAFEAFIKQYPYKLTVYGYGYQNVYELDELVDVNDPRIRFEGTIVGK